MNTLKKSWQFENIYRSGSKWHAKTLLLLYKEGEELTIGLTASKKVGSAVKRNRAKRLFRAIFQANRERLKSGTYVFIAKVAITESTYLDVERDFLYAAKRIGCIAKTD